MAAKVTMSKTRRRLVVSATVATSVLAACVLFLLAFPLDLSRFHSRIESIAGPVLGRELRLRRITLKVLPAPDLTVDGIEAASGGVTAFKAAHLRVRVSLLPLLLRRTVIERLELDDAALFVKRTGDGRFDLEGLFGRSSGSSGRFFVNSLYIRRSSVKLTDEAAQSPVHYDIADIDATMYLTQEGPVYRATGRLLPSTTITLSGTASAADGGSISGSGSIAGLKTAIFNPYFEKASSSSIDALAEARFSYNFGKKKNFKSHIKYSDMKGSFPVILDSPLSSASGSAVLEASWGEKRSIAVRDVRVELPEFTLRGSFGIEGERGAESFTLRGSSTAVPAKTFKEMIPLKKLSAEAHTLAGYISPSAGSVTVKDFALSGPLKELEGGKSFSRPESFAVSVFLKDLSLSFKGLSGTFDEVTGPITLSGGTLMAGGLTGRYGLETIDSFKIALKDLTGKRAYKASVDASVDIAETLKAAREVLAADKKTGPSRQLAGLNASGQAELSLSVSGALNAPSPVRYSGTASLDDASFSHTGLPGSFSSLFADVAFDNKRITVKNARGREGDSDFNLTGFVEDYSKDPLFDFSAEGELTGNTVRKFLPESAAAKLTIGGKAQLKASGSGARSAFAAALYIDTTGAAVEYKGVIKKAPDYTLGLEGFVVLNGTALEVKRADLRFGGSSVSLRGNFHTDKPVYSLLVQSTGLRISDFDDLSPFLIGEYQSSGTINFKVSSTKKTAESEPSYQGVALIKDGRFRSPLISSPVERINAAMMIEGNSGNIRISGMEAGSTSLSGNIDITDVAARKISFSFSSPSLNTDDLIPKETVKEKTQEAAARTGMVTRPRTHPVTGSGQITIDKGSAWGHPFENFRAAVELTPNSAVLDPVTVNIDGGGATGRFSYFKDPGEALLFETRLTLNEIDLETFFSALDVKRKVLTGRLSGEVVLAEKRGSTPFSTGLGGSAHLESSRGRLWKGTILTKIFSLVNILSVDELFKRGLPYRALSGDFSMAHGIISTEDMVLDSDSIKMSAAGELSVPEKKIDAVLALSPFVTVDKIISNIPLAGWIITGKDKGVLTMYFGVDGDIKDPLILPKPITTIEKGVLGILQRIIETPQRLLEPDKKPPSGRE